jgi:hypothetical protein
MNFFRRLFGWPQKAHFGSFRMGYLMGFEAGAQAGTQHVINQIRAQGFDIQTLDDSKPTPDARLN